MTDPRLASVIEEVQAQAMRLRTAVYREQIDADAREEAERAEWERWHGGDAPEGSAPW